MSFVKYTAGAANDDDADARMNIAVRSNAVCFMLVTSYKLCDEKKLNVEAGFTSRENYVFIGHYRTLKNSQSASFLLMKAIGFAEYSMKNLSLITARISKYTAAPVKIIVKV